MGYYADTAGGSSGSPVLGYSDNLVVALHHCANCPNRGVPIPSIISDLGGNIPNDAIGSVGPPDPPVADFSASSTVIEEGQSVNFTDTSTNSPTSWSWTFYGGSPSSSSSQNPSVTYNNAGTYTVSLTATNSGGNDTETKTNYITVTEVLPSVGNTTIFGSTSTSSYRRAMPFTMPADGTISSVTMYHSGGSGNLILGVYDGSGTPANRLGVTPSTALNSSAGWQTINLTSTVFVAGSDTVWLAWVYQSNPGIRYQTGSPGRYQSTSTWSGGMPDPFGSGSQSSYLYSIYALYTPGGGPTQYTLTTNTVGQGTIGLNPSGGTYNQGTVVTVTATPDSGWQFDNWSVDLSGSTNPTTITMNSNKSVTANFSAAPTTATVGNTTQFSSTSTNGSRRAMPFTMTEGGTINSITMYHTGGSGSMILAVYDGTSTPQNRVAITATTAVSGSTGWQTINLTSPVHFNNGETVWLAWVYQSNPGIRYQTGSPGRYQSTSTWSGGMPTTFGSGSQSSYLYSIYGTYTPD
ncbi:MAG: PKD domain-containing protein [bacterium]|nr:PKD domain-containing protein [bacterium]